MPRRQALVRRRTGAAALLLLGFAAVFGGTSSLRADETRRTAILCAYQPECEALLPSLTERRDDIHASTSFVTGRIENTPVVLIESGVGMTNAALSAQAAIDRYRVARLIVMGIAGGINPELNIGDVVIAGQWSEYLHSVFAREKEGKYSLPPFFAAQQSQHFAMIYPQPVEIRKPTGGADLHTWFPVDPDLLDAARRIPTTTELENCTAPQKCLAPAPRLIVGGNGVSGSAFVDNAPFRRFIRQAFDASAVDMESAAVAHVAQMNKVPFLAIRSLSDLAGEDPDKNEMETFQGVSTKNATIVLKALLNQLPQAR